MSAAQHLRPDCNLRLAERTSLGVGGPAARHYEVPTADALVEVWQHEASMSSHRPIVLGDGTNVVISDEGLPGAVVSVAQYGADFEDEEDFTRVRVGAGENWDATVARTVALGLSGIECMSGIPGRCGAAPIQNIGAYGQELQDVVEWVLVLDTSTMSLGRLSGDECEFGYRSSRFKERDRDRYVVLELGLKLSKQPPRDAAYDQLVRAAREEGIDLGRVQARRDLVLRLRRSKSMVLNGGDPWSRSVGSFFMNPILKAAEYERLEHAIRGCPSWPTQDGVKLAAAWLIEYAGIKRGQRCGGAAVSRSHALAIVNVDHATARDVIALAREVRRRVFDATGVLLIPEARFLGFSGDPLAPDSQPHP